MRMDRRRCLPRCGALIGVGVAVGVLGVAAPARAHEPASGGVFFNPLGLIIKYYGIEGGIGVSDNTSLNLSGGVLDLSSGGIEGSAWGMGVGVQYFPKGSLYQGFFIYPSVEYVSAEAENQYGDRATASGYGATFLFGYQWDWRPFTLRLGGGFGYVVANAKGDDDVEVNVGGLVPALDFSIGLTF